MGVIRKPNGIQADYFENQTKDVYASQLQMQIHANQNNPTIFTPKRMLLQISLANVYFVKTNYMINGQVDSYSSIEFSNILKAKSYSTTPWNSLYLVDKNGYLWLFGNNTNGQIEPPIGGTEVPTQWHSAPRLVSVEVDSQELRIRQAHGKYFLTKTGMILMNSDSKKLYTFTKLSASEQMETSLENRQKIMIGTAVPWNHTLNLDESERPEPNYEIIVTTDDIWVRSPLCFYGLDNPIYNYSCGFKPDAERRKQYTKYFKVERALYRSLFKITDIVKVEMYYNLVVYTRLGDVYSFGNDTGQFCGEAQRSKMIHKVGKFLRQAYSYTMKVQDPLDSSKTKTVMSMYNIKAGQLRRCSGQAIVQVTQTEAFNNKLNTALIGYNDSRGYITINYWHYRNDSIHEDTQTIDVQQIKVGKHMTCDANFSLPGTWFTTPDIFSRTQYAIHITKKVFLAIGIIALLFISFFGFIWLRNKFKWCQPGDCDKIIKKYEKYKKARAEENRKEKISEELDKREARAEKIEKKETKEPETVNMREARVV